MQPVAGSTTIRPCCAASSSTMPARAGGADGILAVDEAIGRLEGDDPQAGALVRLRFYAGLDVEDAAKALGVSPRPS